MQTRVNAAALATGDRVTLLLVTTFRRERCCPSWPTRAAGRRPRRCLRRGQAGGAASRIVTGTEETGAGTVAEAAYPVPFHGHVAAVIVYSSPVSDIVRTVATVRHEILVAGGIALLLALIGSYLVARALAQRVKRLELAAEKVAAGDFEHPIPVDSSDELGQLAVAFNEMQRQLAQLESARKKFIATASHELRTPIFSLGGFVELLEDEDLDPETRARFLEQVQDQVERLRKLSVDLLDLSRLESGSLELRPEQVDLGELTRSVSGEFEPVLAQHDSHLELRLPSRRIEAVCDPVRVAQIIRILIDNALAHTPPGPGSWSPRGSDAAPCGWPCATTGRASTRRRCRGSSSRSTRPTTPRARGSGWRSQASSPSGWRGAVGRLAAGRDDVHARDPGIGLRVLRFGSAEASCWTWRCACGRRSSRTRVARRAGRRGRRRGRRCNVRGRRAGGVVPLGVRRRAGAGMAVYSEDRGLVRRRMPVTC